MSGQFLGFIEAIEGRLVRGWCIRLDAKMQAVELVLLLRGIPASRGVTDVARPDVAAQHRCHKASGFAFMLEQDVQPAEIQLLPLGADAPLPRLGAEPQAEAQAVLELDETGWVRIAPFPFA